jgi:hypothetical protein
MTKKGTSLCKGKSVKEPNRCRKVRGCKVAKGTKRTFCRKMHNKTKKVSSSKNSQIKTMRKRK